MKKEKIYALCLLAIIFFSSFIYLYDLGKESLTTDEYFSLYTAQLPLGEIVLRQNKESYPNTIPPAYEIIMHFWLKIFGVSEFAQRSFSALLGIASVYMLYRLACLLFGAPTGILSALFGSLSFSWFSFFRLNRCYGLFIFLTLLSFYVFFNYLQNKEKKSSLPILIAINIVLAYTHYFACLVILVEALSIVFEWKRDKEWAKNILLMLIWVIISYIPWFENLFYDIKREPLIIEKIGYYNIWGQLFCILLAFFSDFHIGWNPALIIIYLPLIILGYAQLIRGKADYFRRRLLYLTLILIIPSIIIYSFTNADRARYYAAFSFPLLIFLSVGIQKINTGRLKKFILLPASLCIITFNITDFYDFFHHPLHEDWKQAVQYIKGVPAYQDKEMVFIFQAKYNPSVFAYYYWGNKVASSFMDNMSSYDSYEKDLSAIKTGHKVYLISDTEGREIFERLDSFPDNAWIWVFRYHYIYSSFSIRLLNNGKYFFHQIMLNKEMPVIDFFLLKKINNN